MQRGRGADAGRAVGGSASGSVAVQVIVSGADESGSREVSVFSRTDTGSGWTLHAEGRVAASAAVPGTELSAWPPAVPSGGRGRLL
ncbi:phenolphthiocerol synthesis polyketide synthase type I Pks15/1 domain protein [Mycobacterium xenopi 4042]|uniref:Phenolphthiocerol synthesis polyketide synthase type I Pks15/1 domain protein n=1 Tax=Mycobacterium xenopi 4042 TaxID=1299334 RepID=X7Z175_MYCXE|nr:phenolphthiocerol synthesis polyketide synthase type I Pks15/1 domain protein [Mycobacterium xenopi 4042]